MPIDKVKSATQQVPTEVVGSSPPSFAAPDLEVANEVSRLAAGGLTLLMAGRVSSLSDEAAHPVLLAEVLTILESPSMVAEGVTLDARTHDEAHRLAGVLTAHVSEKWRDQFRRLKPSEKAQILKGLELRLKAVGRVDPSFLFAVSDYLTASKSVISLRRISAYPHRVTSPWDTALSYLWGFLIHYAQWGIEGLLSESTLPSSLFSFVWNGKEIPDLWVAVKPGAPGISGGIEMSLWWDGNVKPHVVVRQKSVRLVHVGILWTPLGFVIEQVQGEPNLLGKRVFLGDRGVDLLQHVQAALQEDLRTAFTAYVVDELRRQQPERPIFYRKGSCMNSIPLKAAGLPIPEAYSLSSRVHSVEGAARYIPPEKLLEMIAAAIDEMENHLRAIETGTSHHHMDYWHKVHWPAELAELRRVPSIWKRLDDIARRLGFEEDPQHVSLWVLPPRKPTRPSRREALLKKANGRVGTVIDSPESLQALGEELLVPMKFMVVELPNGKKDLRVGNSPLHRREHGDAYHYWIIEKDLEGQEISKKGGAISLERESFYPFDRAESRSGWTHEEFLEEGEEVVAAGYLVRAGGILFMDGRGLSQARGFLASTLREQVRMADTIFMERGEVNVHQIRADLPRRHYSKIRSRTNHPFQGEGGAVTSLAPSADLSLGEIAATEGLAEFVVD